MDRNERCSSTEERRVRLPPVWSPNGERVAFALGNFFQQQPGAAIADIAVVNRDGSGIKVLTKGSGNVGFPSWSPDGSQIAFFGNGDGNDGWPPSTSWMHGGPPPAVPGRTSS